MSSLKTNKIGECQQYETQMKTRIIEGETPSKRTGRIAIPVEYSEIDIDGITCIKGSCRHKDSRLEFIIDKDDYAYVKSRHWYSMTSGKYVGCKININNKSHTVGLHNFIMNKIDFPGKGAKETIDHINRNGLDNRKCNLRLVSQSLQRINQKSRARSAQLPEGISELPKHIWYIKPNGAHGDRFCIELKTEGITWKTTSSKKVSIEEKLEQAKKKLVELYEEFPYLK